MLVRLRHIVVSFNGRKYRKKRRLRANLWFGMLREGIFSHSPDRYRGHRIHSGFTLLSAEKCKKSHFSWVICVWQNNMWTTNMCSKRLFDNVENFKEKRIFIDGKRKIVLRKKHCWFIWNIACEMNWDAYLIKDLRI